MKIYNNIDSKYSSKKCDNVLVDINKLKHLLYCIVENIKYVNILICVSTNKNTILKILKETYLLYCKILSCFSNVDKDSCVKGVISRFKKYKGVIKSIVDADKQYTYDILYKLNCKNIYILDLLTINNNK